MSVNFSQHDVNMHESKMSSKMRVSQPEDFDGLESKLHAKIMEECGKRRWMFFHGSMAHKSKRTAGETDFTIAADNGVVFFIEAKRKGEKLSEAQNIVRHCLIAKGHRWACVYSFKDFISFIEKTQ